MRKLTQKTGEVIGYVFVLFLAIGILALSVVLMWRGLSFILGL